MTELPLHPNPPDSSPDPSVVVLGRFQPFHRGHESMLIRAENWRSANCPETGLIICIGSSNQPQSLENPWDYQERSAMVQVWMDCQDFNAEIVCIPDIEDPPNWVRHAERYHGEAGTMFTTDIQTAELYEAAGWDVIIGDLQSRENFEGWRVRATAKMLSTVSDEDAVLSILSQTIPERVASYLINEGAIVRLAFLGESGEPVG